MTIAAADIIRGPAIVFIGATAIYTEGDIECTERIETFQVGTSIFGPSTDERVDAIIQEISFTPIGDWAYRTALMPYLDPTIGASVFSGTDVHIHTLAGVKKTLHNAAITQMPTINFGTTQQLWGPVTLTSIGADDTAWSDAAKRQTIASEAFADASFDPDDIITQPYAVAWGIATPWSAIETEEGVTLENDLTLEPVTVDSEGLVDMTVGNVGFTATLRPVGVTEAELLDLLKIQGAGVARGKTLRGNSNDLTITGTGVSCTLTQSSPVAGPTRYGSTVLRAGDLGFRGVRKYTIGVQSPLVTLGV